MELPVFFLTSEVLDVTGRRVYIHPPVEMSTGWGAEVALYNLSIPSGIYLYRLTIESAEGIDIQADRFVKIH
ncbi:MAG: hypothetical protein OXE59_13280 [Bacteroidetes bacterium]|nr:hypothetical protein [Bacteroidota bacterium]